MEITSTEYAGFEAYKLATDNWETICIPELGANLPEFFHLPTGRQWLWVNPNVPTQKHDYGCPYGWGSADGIDECFPAIALGRYPLAPYKGTVIPDHGDVWTLPWVVEAASGVLRTEVHGPLLPYRFERTLSEGEDGGLLFSYRLTNTSDVPISYIWSSHAVCIAKPGMFIDVERGARFRVYNSRGNRFGDVGSTHEWGEGQAGNISRIPDCDPTAMFSHKLFIEHVKRDWVALYDPGTDSHLRFSYDTANINTVGLWMQMCAAPGTDQIALEPCMGTYDGLEESLEAGTALSLGPRKTHAWWWSLTPGLGRPSR